MHPKRIEVIYHDPHTLIVNKPTGIVVENPSSPAEASLKNTIRKQFPTARPVHRIDKETSGLMIWALSDDAYRYYSGRFSRQEIIKIYHAVGCGVMHAKGLDVKLPILRTSSQKGRISHRYGKPAHTHIRPIKIFRHFTLVECQPFTGRLHQIRIHMAAIGHPIAGDSRYGGCLPLLSEIKPNYRPKKSRDELPLIRRTALHATKLTFTPYQRKTACTLEAPYPKDLRALLQQLNKYDTPAPSVYPLK